VFSGFIVGCFGLIEVCLGHIVVCSGLIVIFFPISVLSCFSFCLF